MSRKPASCGSIFAAKEISDSPMEKPRGGRPASSPSAKPGISGFLVSCDAAMKKPFSTAAMPGLKAFCDVGGVGGGAGDCSGMGADSAQVSVGGDGAVGAACATCSGGAAVAAATDECLLAACATLRAVLA